ncbi:MAG: hypothetical protein AB9866_23485 [Syntrophobacteraceae bacterium]
MKRITTLCLVITLMSFSFFIQSSAAIKPGDDSLELTLNAPVSVKAGQSFIMKLFGENKEWESIFVSSVTATVIDPWTGTRIAGPTPTTIGKTLVGRKATWVGGVYTEIPGGTFGKTISVSIPASAANKTLGIVIYALDPESEVRGVIGWGFVVLP